MRKAINILLLILVVILQVPNFGLCLSEKDEVLKAITESYAKHVDAHKRQDAAGASALYSEDVWMIDDSGFEVKSRKEVEKIYAQNYASGMVIKELKYTTDELTILGDIAVEMGGYIATMESLGQEVILKYRWMVVWQRQQADLWKIHRARAYSIKASE